MKFLLFVFALLFAAPAFGQDAKIVDNHKSYSDTCAFYANIYKPTSDYTGLLLLNSTDLSQAIAWTRCDCGSPKDLKVAPLPGEVFLTATTYGQALVLKYNPNITMLHTVWAGNTARYALNRK